ncbi:hypothetical protein [Dictyobacter formicarum]|uniref:hypothetical protein n=1 Tax=Dictyobacter formicarum TaxID=2778368 RepID=UPI0019162AD0|nr:hypothetical protein [Dictyobacter formicarum]
MLAITAAVVAMSTASVQDFAPNSSPSVMAPLSGLHAGLLVLAGGAALGALIAAVFIQKQPATNSRPGKQPLCP